MHSISPVVLSAPGQAGDAEAQRATLVIDGLARSKRLADGDRLRILGLFGRAGPAGVVAGRHTCLSQVSVAEVVRHLGANAVR
jgi:hypothetical protein